MDTRRERERMSTSKTDGLETALRRSDTEGMTPARPTVLLSCLLILAGVSTACDLLKKNTPASPSPSSPSSFTGLWMSSSSATPAAGACSGFRWRITSASGTTVTGDFVASCAGGVTITGTASGTLDGSTTMQWGASGVATAPGFPDCRFLLSGTATLDGNTIQVPYSGSTCLGPVSGTEILTKS